ncbi:hypothetical protein D3C87_1808970 [compost metagenome]
MIEDHRHTDEHVLRPLMHADRFQGSEGTHLAGIELLCIVIATPFLSRRIRSNDDRATRDVEHRDVVTAIAHVVETALAEAVDKCVTLAAARQIECLG